MPRQASKVLAEENWDKPMRLMMNIKLGCVFGLAFGLITSTAGAQSQPPQTQDEPSLGDYARKVHKDPSAAPAKPKIYDNDNLPKDDKLSVVGPAPSTDTTSSAAANDKSSTDNKAPADSKTPADNKAAAGAKPADDEQAKKQAAWKAWQEKLSAQKDQIDLAGRELDVTQREYQLRAAEMYADAGNRMRNAASWDKQDAEYKQKIADKQKAVDDAKQKLSDMQEDARKAGVPSSMIE
jgi:hypothetical protein